jgi:hypothetical protein
MEHLSFTIYHPTKLPPSPSAATTPVPNADSSKEKNDSWTFKVENGNKGVQVGSWTTDVTYNGILGALRERCDQLKKWWGADKCSGGDWGFYAEYTDMLGQWLEEKNAAIIKITSDYLLEEYGKTLQDAFVEQIADVFSLAVKTRTATCSIRKLRYVRSAWTNSALRGQDLSRIDMLHRSRDYCDGVMRRTTSE